MLDLNVSEIKIVEHFKVQKKALIQADSTNSVVDRALQRLSMTRIYTRDYIEKPFKLRMTNKVEWVFSTYGLVLTNNRRLLSPCNAETQILIYSNRRL